MSHLIPPRQLRDASIVSSSSPPPVLRDDPGAHTRSTAATSNADIASSAASASSASSAFSGVDLTDSSASLTAPLLPRGDSGRRDAGRAREQQRGGARLPSRPRRASQSPRQPLSSLPPLRVFVLTFNCAEGWLREGFFADLRVPRNRDMYFLSLQVRTQLVLTLTLSRPDRTCADPDRTCPDRPVLTLTGPPCL